MRRGCWVLVVGDGLCGGVRWEGGKESVRTEEVGKMDAKVLK